MYLRKTNPLSLHRSNKDKSVQHNYIELHGVIFSLKYLRSIKKSPNPDLLNKYCGLKAVLDSM